MSESIKWSETNVGKYSMFDVELGGIKTTVSCDSENSAKLISLLNELEHTHTVQSEELEALRKQIKSSVLLSEAERSTLALMRKQIDDLLGTEVKGIGCQHHYARKPVYGYDLVNFLRATKILGFKRDDVGKYMHIAVYDFLQNYNITWDILGTSEDKFYSNFFNFDVSNSPTERRSYYTYIVQNDDLLLKWSKESLNKLSDEYNIPLEYLWAYYILKSRNFTIVDYNGKEHIFMYDLEPKNVGKGSTRRYIKAKGGIPMLKRLRKKGYSQVDIAKEWGVYPASISLYIRENGEKWSEWLTDC